MHTKQNSPNSQSFWDRIADKYAKKPISDIGAYEDKIQAIKQLLKQSDRVLEIGCGTGGTALRLAPEVSTVTATDISGAMIDIANAKLETQVVDNVTFIQAPSDQLVTDTPFNVICAFSLLHLVDNIPETLNSIWDQLKPGGVFISKTVCLKEGSIFIRALIPLLTIIGYAPRVKTISQDELVKMIEEVGFEVETVKTFGQQHNNPFVVARRPSV